MTHKKLMNFRKGLQTFLIFVVQLLWAIFSPADVAMTAVYFLGIIP